MPDAVEDGANGNDGGRRADHPGNDTVLGSVAPIQFDFGRFRTI